MGSSVQTQITLGSEVGGVSADYRAPDDEINPELPWRRVRQNCGKSERAGESSAASAQPPACARSAQQPLGLQRRT